MLWIFYLMSLVFSDTFDLLFSICFLLHKWFLYLIYRWFHGVGAAYEILVLRTPVRFWVEPFFDLMLIRHLYIFILLLDFYSWFLFLFNCIWLCVISLLSFTYSFSFILSFRCIDCYWGGSVVFIVYFLIDFLSFWFLIFYC